MTVPITVHNDKIAAITADVMARLTADGTNGCRHVDAHTTHVVVCALHPDRLKCQDCAERHVTGHGVELEHTCDLCNAFVPDIWGFVSRWVAIVADTTTGRRRLLRVFVIGLGACPDCADVVLDNGTQRWNGGRDERGRE